MCTISLCKNTITQNEKWNHTKARNTNTAHCCGLPCLCPGLPLQQAKSVRQQGQRGKPQHCRFITSACLSFPLESLFQPLKGGEGEGGGDQAPLPVSHSGWAECLGSPSMAQTIVRDVCLDVRERRRRYHSENKGRRHIICTTNLQSIFNSNNTSPKQNVTKTQIGQLFKGRLPVKANLEKSLVWNMIIHSVSESVSVQNINTENQILWMN